LVYALPFPAGFYFNNDTYTMYVFIHGDRLLRELQDEFQASYPYLKMRFLWRRYPDDKNITLSEYQEPYIRLSEISGKKSHGFITMEDDTRVDHLIKLFQSDFGLSVYFFHYTNAGWVSASDIKTATLGELNEQGRICFHRIHNISAKPDNLL
jgi:hypothetical protein